MTFHSAFKKRKAVKLSFAGTTSKTEQSHVPATLLKNIVARYKTINGQNIQEMPNLHDYSGDFLKYTPDYMSETLNTYTAIQEDFAHLPSKVREEYNNDPLAFYEDQYHRIKNEEEAAAAAPTASKAADASMPLTNDVPSS